MDWTVLASVLQPLAEVLPQLHVDAPGRKDGAEELEAADVHARLISGDVERGKPDAEARGGKGLPDLEQCVGTPKQVRVSRMRTRPRADSVRVVEHAPV